MRLSGMNVNSCWRAARSPGDRPGQLVREGFRSKRPEEERHDPGMKSVGAGIDHIRRRQQGIEPLRQRSLH